MLQYPNRPQDAEKFRKDVEKYTKWATESKERAQQVLINLGIYNEDGMLTDEYNK